MTEDELDVAYREGRLTKRAYVRQLIQGDHDMTSALERAETLVPAEPAPEPEASFAAPLGHDSALPSGWRPQMTEDLDINFVGDGYVVHQPGRKRMHSLNATAAVVLELCTGVHDDDDIARLLQTSFDLEQPPLTETRQCLRSLRNEGLIR